MIKGAVVSVVVLASSLAGCASSPQRTEFYAKHRPATYHCGGPHYACHGTYADLVQKLPEPLPSCIDIGARFKASQDIPIRLLSHEAFYPNEHIGAVLLADLDYTVTIEGHGPNAHHTIYVRVPHGFVTDFASVPRGLPQAFHRTLSKTDKPAIAHDFLYAMGREPCDPGNTKAYCKDPHRQEHERLRQEARLLADEVLEQGMKDNFSRGISYGSVFLAVRVGGANGYGRHEELRFLSEMTNSMPLVVPSDEFDETEGYAKRLREAYVRDCPPR